MSPLVIVRRLLLVVPTLFGVALVVFVPAPSSKPMVHNVLFVCTGDSARSILAGG